MQSLKKILQTRLNGAKAIALLGIGSELVGDDVAGVMVAEAFLKTKCRSRRFKAFCGCTVPENMTGEIKKFRPSHVILVDAVDMKGKAGAITVFEPKEEKAGASFTSHRFPIAILAHYLEQSCACQVIGIGIQPKVVKFGARPSKEVRLAVRRVIALIKSSLPE